MRRGSYRGKPYCRGALVAVSIVVLTFTAYPQANPEPLSQPMGNSREVHTVSRVTFSRDFEGPRLLFRTGGYWFARDTAPANKLPAGIAGMEKMQKYMPMKSGSRWLYRVSVPNKDGKWPDLLHIQQGDPSLDSGGVFVSLDSWWKKVQTVSYFVAGAPSEQQGFWKVEECVNGCPGGPTPKLWGPYIVPDRLLVTAESAAESLRKESDRSPSEDKKAAIPLVAQESDLVYFADRYSTEQPVNSIRKETHDSILLWGEGGAAFLRSLLGSGVELAEKAPSSPVVVPAGEFVNCLQISIKVPREALESRAKAPIERARLPGIVEDSYFAPGVGLIKRVAKDDTGKMNYLLELVSHGAAKRSPTGWSSPRRKASE